MTYLIGLPKGSNGLKVFQKYSTNDEWIQIIQKTSTDLFNGVNAVRFDYPSNRAYVSVPFSSNTDSLFLEITDATNRSIEPLYRGISKYYDNRRAAVIVTADDWSDWVDVRFIALTQIFRSYGLYLTIGVISNSANCSQTTWGHIQQLLLMRILLWTL
jgi:hypothetical protein